MIQPGKFFCKNAIVSRAIWRARHHHVKTIYHLGPFHPHHAKKPLATCYYWQLNFFKIQWSSCSHGTPHYLLFWMLYMFSYLHWQRKALRWKCTLSLASILSWNVSSSSYCPNIKLVNFLRWSWSTGFSYYVVLVYCRT